ncbi:MAG: hypothetical protein ABL930_08285 [Pseudobdellovibrio sp.]
MLIKLHKYSYLIGVWLLLHLLFVLALFNLNVPILAASLGLWFLIGCFGLEIHFHRKCSHSLKSFDFKSVLFTVIGHLGCQGSAIFFTATHLRHHQFSDTKRDPHSPLYGWWDAYVGWSIKRRHVLYGLSGKNCSPNVFNNKIFRFLHQYYIEFIWGVWIIAYLINPAFFYALIIAQVFSFNQSAFFVNILSHKKIFLSENFHKTTAFNNFYLALISWGVALHDFHHRYPHSKYYSQKWYEVDIAGRMIKTLWHSDKF